MIAKSKIKNQKSKITEGALPSTTFPQLKVKPYNIFSSLFLKLKSGAGFTLIEIIVVIAIIGVLAAFLFGQFGGVRERTRDTQRKADLRQIQSALELIRADEGCYPWSGGCSGATGLPACGNALTAGGNTYMASMPCDPTGNAGFGVVNGSYLYASSDGRSYTLTACLENLNDPDIVAGTTCTTINNNQRGFQVRTP